MTVFNKSVDIDWEVPQQDGIGVAQVIVPPDKEWKIQAIFCPAIPGGARVILTYTALDWSHVSFLRVFKMPGKRGQGSYIVSAAIGLESEIKTPKGVTGQLPDIKITEGMAAQLKLIGAERDPNPVRVDFSIEE